jgi:hypothetical protein
MQCIPSNVEACRLTENTVHRNTQETRAGVRAQSNSQANQQSSHPSYDEVQDEVEPSLDAEEQVVRSLREIEQPVVLGPVLALPPECPNGDDPFDTLQEMGV